MLSERSSGKSGSFFFHSSDGKYMVKTIKIEEFDLLLRILPDYYKHLTDNPNTLMTWYYGLHQIKCYKRGRLIYHIYITVMNNILDTENPELIREIYDLKGSWYGRYTKPKNF